ncbi:MAG: hypothetical protein WA742_17955 [Candidatus Cybelea sp.]
MIEPAWCEANATAGSAHLATEPKRIDDVRRYLAKIAAQWDDALQRLKSAVEN